MVLCAKQGSKSVLGLDTALDFVQVISREVCELGGNDDDLRKVITQATLRRKIAELIVRPPR